MGSSGVLCTVRVAVALDARKLSPTYALGLPASPLVGLYSDATWPGKLNFRV